MLRFVLLCLSLALAAASPRILTIDGYPLTWLREAQPGTPQPQELFRQTPVPLLPLTSRVIYRTYEEVRVGYTYNQNQEKVIVVSGKGLLGVRMKLIAPDATDCSATAYTSIGPLASPGLPETPANFGNIGNNLRYFNAPTDTEIPHEHLMPWICVCAASDMGTTGCENPVVGGRSNWIHTNMRLAVVRRCDGDAVSRASDHNILNLDWDLCDYVQTWTQPSQAFGEVDIYGQVSFTSKLYLERKQRSRCCGWRNAGLTDSLGNILQKRWGMCINPLFEGCCSRNTNDQGTFMATGGIGKPYNIYREKCCYGGVVSASAEVIGSTRTGPEATVINYLDDPCPCNKANVASYCNQVVPKPPTDVIPANSCCTKTKYPELIKSFENQIWGKCYDGINMKCCDTGDLYDPGTNQCCSINGVQSVNVGCPCSADNHCGINQTCCQDNNRPIFPAPQENLLLCNKYVNYPNGTGPFFAQPCIGQCMDTRFQICCNGKLCIDKYEACCNNTCCNKFNQRCTFGLRAGARGFVNNPKDFRIPYEVCTTTEALTPYRAIQVFVLPIFLLAATFVSLAATLFFAKRQSTLQPMSTYEKTLFALCCLLIALGWPFFFSPLYKYGISMVWVGFFAMLASMSQLRSLNIATIFVIGIHIIYMIDPFYGNDILTLASRRSPPPIDSVHGYAGIVDSITMMAIFGQAECTTWYDYFLRDANVEDRLRWDNPNKTSFGFCARGWFVTLVIAAVVGQIVAFLMFFVSLMIHIRNILFEKAQKTDEIVGWY